MSRTSAQPVEYATIRDLEHSFLTQVRRVRSGMHALAARAPIVLSAPGMDTGERVASRPRGNEDGQHLELEHLHAQVLLLQNMSGQISTKFPGDAKANDIRRRIEMFTDVLQKRSDELRENIGRAARKVVSRPVVVRNHALMNSLKSALGKKVHSISEMYMVGDALLPGMRNEPVRCDVAYLRLVDLRGSDGFVHPNYYIATAHPTEPGNGRLMPMYVSGGPDYRVPMRLRWTVTAKSPQELLRVSNDMLVHEGVIGGSVERDLPVPHDDVKFVHDNVKKVTVQGNQIRVLVKNRDDIEETRGALRRQLTSIVRRVDPRNRDVIRDRVDPVKGWITLVFSLPGGMRGRLVDADVLRRIGTMLDLDAPTLQRVRTAIEDPE